MSIIESLLIRCRGCAGSNSALHGSLQRLLKTQRGHMLVGGDPPFGRELRAAGKVAEALGIDSFDHPEARLVPHVVLHRDLSTGHVDHQGRLARGDPARIEAKHRPDAAVYGALLLIEPEGHVITMRDAVAVGDDERRPWISVRFHESAYSLRVARTEGDGGYVHMPVVHGHQTEILLVGSLAMRGELRRRAERCGFGRLPPGVGVDLGV